MKYDVLLTGVGQDELSVALSVMNTIQQMMPLVTLDVARARQWMNHLPVLLRRGITGNEARDLQLRYEQLGAAVAIIPSELFFPQNHGVISRWHNEWFSEHLTALHEKIFTRWAEDNHADEAYRFSYLPSFGLDMTIRIWKSAETLCAHACRSIGRIGPLPGPPAQEIFWNPDQDHWDALCGIMKDTRFWESETWDTVPEGYILIDGNHWIMEGWRKRRYHVLVDQTPNEGAAREVGLLLFDLLPEGFDRPEIE